MFFNLFRKLFEWRYIKIQEPKVIIKNTSTDDFMKIHVPWIL